MFDNLPHVDFRFALRQTLAENHKIHSSHCKKLYFDLEYSEYSDKGLPE
jgi:hypothetical protein